MDSDKINYSMWIVLIINTIIGTVNITLYPDSIVNLIVGAINLFIAVGLSSFLECFIFHKEDKILKED